MVLFLGGKCTHPHLRRLGKGGVILSPGFHPALYSASGFAEKTKDEKCVEQAPAAGGVPFLGTRIFGNLIRIQRPNLIRFRKKIKKLESDYMAGKICENDLVNSIEMQ